MKPLRTGILHTPRLILRTPREDDVPRIVELAGDRHIAEMTLVIPHPYLPEHALAWIAEDAKRREAGSGCEFLIDYEAVVVGAIGLVPDAASRRATTGYWIGRRYWRRGFATEALREVLRHAFGELGLLYVGAHHVAGNPASGRVMQKAGMRFENIVHQGIERDGVLHDRVNYGVFADEWRNAGGRGAGSNAYLL